MHHEIKNFYLTGTITSDKFVATRERLIKEVEDGMRDDGFVPVLELLPQFTRSFNPEENNFTFELTIYGVYIGEEDAWRIAGLDNGKPVEKSTHPTK